MTKKRAFERAREIAGNKALWRTYTEALGAASDGVAQVST